MVIRFSLARSKAILSALAWKDEAALHAFVQSSHVRVMVVQLRALGISVELNQERYQNGRFARLNDPEGYPIQLGEPRG